MKLDSLAIEEFKDFIFQSMNEQIYYELKTWVMDQLDEDQEWDEVMDFFVNNLHGSLEWTNE